MIASVTSKPELLFFPWLGPFFSCENNLVLDPASATERVPVLSPFNVLIVDSTKLSITCHGLCHSGQISLVNPLFDVLFVYVTSRFFAFYVYCMHLCLLLSTLDVAFSDTFNENTPPTNEPAYISSLGYAIFDAMSRGNKDAVWLMQVCSIFFHV
jgi:hypothetical protein